MNITKKEILQKLHDIEVKNKIKLDHETQLVIRNRVIPMDVIKIINKYDNQFLKIYDTFNTIYNARNKNPLYKNLTKMEISDDELAVSVSSFVTKILISCTKMNNDDKTIFVRAMDLDGITRAISEYSVDNNPTELHRCANEIKNLFNLLYND